MGGDLLGLLVAFEDETMGGLSPITTAQRQSTLIRFLRWCDGRLPADITAGQIAEWLDLMGPDRRGRNIGDLHRFYVWLINTGLADRDPVATLVHVRQPLTVGQLPGVLADWTAAMERKGLASTTILVRTRKVRVLADFLAPKTVFDATEADLEHFLDTGQLREAPIGADARRGYISGLHRFYTWARRQGLIEVDPTEDMDRPRRPERTPRPIGDTQLGAALEQAAPDVRAVLALAAFCGLRAKEIGGIQREDILDHLGEPMLVVSAPKGRRQRTVPLHPEAWQALVAHGLPPSAGPVFVDAAGRQRPPWKISHLANDHLAGCGIGATLHQLRHWYATNVYAASLDLRLTQELLGHSSPTTTAIYTKMTNPHATAIVGTLSVAPRG